MYSRRGNYWSRIARKIKTNIQKRTKHLVVFAIAGTNSITKILYLIVDFSGKKLTVDWNPEKNQSYSFLAKRVWKTISVFIIGIFCVIRPNKFAMRQSNLLLLWRIVFHKEKQWTSRLKKRIEKNSLSEMLFDYWLELTGNGPVLRFWPIKNNGRETSVSFWHFECSSAK